MMLDIFEFRSEEMLRAVLLFFLPALALSLVSAACGGRDDSTGGDRATTQPRTTIGATGGGPTQASGQSSGGNAGANAEGDSVSGQLQLSGKLNGTFVWNKDLALICYVSTLEVTLSDGKDAFIALTAQKTVQAQGLKGRTRLTSGKLSGVFEGAEASFDTKIPSSNALGATGSISFNGTEVKNPAGDTVTINGKLTLNCP